MLLGTWRHRVANTSHCFHPSFAVRVASSTVACSTIKIRYMSHTVTLLQWTRRPDSSPTATTNDGASAGLRPRDSTPFAPRASSSSEIILSPLYFYSRPRVLIESESRMIMLKLHTNVSLSLRGPFSVGEKIMTDILISYLRRRLNSADSDLH